MNTFDIRVNDETVDYMERLSFEIEGSKRIIKELITDNDTNSSILESETFKKFNARYEEKFAAFEIAKQELEREYIPKVLVENFISFKWNLNFSTGIMTITVLDPDFDMNKLEA